MDNPNQSARHIFKLFQAKMAEDSELRSELETAIDILRSSYNTTIRENRFIVGGAVEHFVVATFNGARLPAQHVGVGDTRIDVRVQAGGKEAGFSVKASFSTLNVRLINTLGESSAAWVDPSLFFITNVGIVYADPELLPEATKTSKDALLLKGKVLKAFIKDYPEWVTPIRIEKRKKGKIPSSKTASEDVARNILANSKKLLLP